MRSPFSRRTDYAIRAAVEIARHDGARVKRHPIATAIDAPTTVVAQALADLVRGDIVDAAAGRTGGYVLSRPAHQLTVADVVAAVEVDPEPRCVLEERGCADAAPVRAARDAVRGPRRVHRAARDAVAGQPRRPRAPAKRPATADAPAAHDPPGAAAARGDEPVATGPRPSLGGWLD